VNIHAELCAFPSNRQTLIWNPYRR